MIPATKMRKPRYRVAMAMPCKHGEGQHGHVLDNLSILTGAHAISLQ